MEENVGEDETRELVLSLQKEELGLPEMRKHVFLSGATEEELQICI